MSKPYPYPIQWGPSEEHRKQQPEIEKAAPNGLSVNSEQIPMKDTTALPYITLPSPQGEVQTGSHKTGTIKLRNSELLRLQTTKWRVKPGNISSLNVKFSPFCKEQHEPSRFHHPQSMLTLERAAPLSMPKAILGPFIALKSILLHGKKKPPEGREEGVCYFTEYEAIKVKNLFLPI